LKKLIPIGSKISLLSFVKHNQVSISTQFISIIFKKNIEENVRKTNNNKISTFHFFLLKKRLDPDLESKIWNPDLF